MTCAKNKGVIFDFDGVIIDSTSVMEKAFKYSFNKFFPEKEAPFGDFIKHMGKGLLAIMEAMDLPREMCDPFREKSIELISEIVVFPKIKGIIKSLKDSSCYIGIATGKDSFRTKQILDQKKLTYYFDKIICSDQIKQGKPHPESINFHIQESGLNKESIIFIGDSVSDIRCAKNAGVLSIAVLWGMGKHEDLIKEEPDFIALNTQKLKEILEKELFIRTQLNFNKYI